ncbi:terminase small subunit [Agrilactobacillus yilanensis]|uniref:Terminase small subunit n=1 Tax=Agrilactobacillus yilanensis TaxID=2485997 RepID=A0ABW4J5M7_9LACO
MHPKTKRDAPKVAFKVIDELEANDELNEKRKLFCLFYLQRFNATWAYQAYKCSYSTAQKNSWSLMANQGIKDQLTALKK